MDPRSKLRDWPRLISVDYTFCNGLGKEAHDGGLGAFFAPSAQHQGGTTVPAFIEETLSSFVIEATARLTFNGGTLAEIKELPSS